MSDEQFEKLRIEIRKTAAKLEFLQRIHEGETGRRLHDIGDLTKTADRDSSDWKHDIEVWEHEYEASLYH